jgi:hypothetical protein
MERCILVKLDWNLRASPTAYDFIHLFQALVTAKCPKPLALPTGRSTSTALNRMLVSCLTSTELLHHAPSTVALAVISLYLKLTWDYWLPATHALLSFIQLRAEELSDCCEAVSHSLGPSLIDILRGCSARDSPLRIPAASCTQRATQEPSKASLPPSLPVTPHPPPAKRRKVEEDEDIYSDIRNLYDICDAASVDAMPDRSLTSCAGEVLRASMGQRLAPVITN